MGVRVPPGAPLFNGEYMEILYTIAAVWVIGAIIFFAFIRVEANKRDVEFNILQLIVAIFWWLWAIWYGCVLVGDWWRNK